MVASSTSSSRSTTTPSLIKPERTKQERTKRERNATHNLSKHHLITPKRLCSPSAKGVFKHTKVVLLKRDDQGLEDEEINIFDDLEVKPTVTKTDLQKNEPSSTQPCEISKVGY